MSIHRVPDITAVSHIFLFHDMRVAAVRAECPDFLREIEFRVIVVPDYGIVLDPCLKAYAYIEYIVHVSDTE